MKYKYEYMSMTQIGKLFGATSHQIGKWLKELGLRDGNGSPSSEAFERNLVDQRFDAKGNYIYQWHSEKTFELLEAAGHERVIDPPTDLVEPPQMKGPFKLRESENDTWRVVGSDSEVAIIVTGSKNARVVERLINLAHRTTFLDHLSASIS
ncbi:hypothetical protein [Lignipirellula cremea]|uniref:Uncharacterized protein n=1 Tax=Lignipirellula cremea TaxID=2528010 RepID=A0A518DQL3_9BACT|nr:hypothetical protein [Lignipirellula cremea]QDU94128.1 hypothetical protein Pla8534_19140 [Lignipirellula cremea]